MTGTNPLLRLVAAARKEPAPVVAREALPFQSDASMIENAPTPLAARATIWILGLALASVVVWASLAQLDRVVTTRGRLVTTTPKLVVQPLEIAVVRRILVTPGEIVRKDQVLAELDPTFAEADLAELHKARRLLEAQAARLHLELDGGDASLGDPAAPEVRMQQALLEQRRRERQLKFDALDQRAAEITAEKDATEASRTLVARQLLIAEEIEGMRIRLAKDQTIPRASLLDATQHRLEMELAQRSAADRIIQLGHEAQLVATQRAGLDQEWRRQAQEELIGVDHELGGIVERLEKAARRSNLVALRAPADAVVLEIADRSADSVVKEAEALMTLVPLGQPLEAEIEVDPADVGFIGQGDAVRVKLDAFPYQRHGLIDGKLRLISEDTLIRNAAMGQAAAQPPTYYRGRVQLGPVQLRDLPGTVRLMPGMTVTAEILVGQRRAITYFLDPLIRVFDESLRET